MKTIIYVFTYLFMKASGGGAERKGENESQAGFALSAQSPLRGLNPQTPGHEIMTWAENKSWMLNRLSHPGVPWMKTILLYHVVARGCSEKIGLYLFLKI